ncbi:MAG: hypothetical protein H7Y32_12730 [Chloroflexales bacterium]|nr:hypothetical protein [Chloroflexales bacterium]
MQKKIDWRTAAIIVGVALLGAAWAYFQYRTTFGPAGEPLRGEQQLRPLVWTIFATPLATFIGWTIARRREVWLAAGVCFCIYFFSPFVGARIESLVLDATDAAQIGHVVYFQAVIVLNLLAAVAVAAWRALREAGASDRPLIAADAAADAR